MQRKQVIFVADSLDNAHKFQQVLSSLDVDVAAGSSAQFKKLLGASRLRSGRIRGAWRRLGGVAGIESLLLEDGSAALLVIVGEDQLGELSPARAGEERLRGADASPGRVRGAHPPAAVARQRGATSDFVVVDEHDGEPGHLPGHRGRRAARPHLPRVRAAGLPRHAPRRARTRATRCCAACGASTTTAARARWTSTSAASARSSAPNWLSTWKPSAASATSGAHRSEQGSRHPRQTSQQEPPPPR